MDKYNRRYHMFDAIIYGIACIVSLGLVYLIRVIITEAVFCAMSRQDGVVEYRKLKDAK